MGKKSGPSPPDPVATANAQAGANVDAATANSWLNNADQVGPYGTVDYKQTGTQTVGTGDSMREIPTFTVETTLSPQEQALYDNSSALSNTALTTGNQLLGNVSGTLSTPYEVPTDAPGQVSGVQGGPIQTQIADRGGPVSGFDAGPDLQYGWGADPSQRQIAGAGDIQRGIAPAGNIQGSVASGGNVQGQVGNTAGNIAYAPGGAGQGIAGQIDINGLPTRPGSTDFSTDREKYYDAMMARQNQDFTRREQELSQSLANQGIAYGTEAWRNAMDDLNRSRVDAQNQTYLAAGNEQSRMFGLESQARGQAFNEQQNMGAFQNAAQQQGFGQNIAAQQAQNAAQAQDWSQILQRAGLNNEAVQQLFGMNLAQGQFANQAQGQQFGQNAAAMDAANAAQQQQFGQNQAQGQFNNAAIAQDFNFNQALADFYNQTAGQQYEQNQGQAAFYNQAQDAQFGQDQARAVLNNQAQGQEFAQGTQNAALQNAARQQAIQESLLPRNQNVNEVATLFGLGGDVNMPQFQQYGSSIAPGDIQGNTYASYQGKVAQWQQQSQNRNALIGALAQMGSSAISAAAMSDRRMKRDIVPLRATIGGFPAYQFRYVDGTERHIGVMAQEVMVSRPDAVFAVDGILHVDYGRL